MTEDKIDNLVDRIESRFRVLQWVIGGAVTFLFAFAMATIPWAFVVQADLASIKTTINMLEIPPAWFEAQVEENKRHIKILEQEMNVLKNKLSNGTNR